MDEKKINTQDGGKPSRLKRTMPKGAMIGGIVAMVLVVSYLLVCTVAATSADRVLPGTKVAGVSVGGMTLDEVEVALQDAQVQWLAQEDAYLVFAVEDDLGEQFLVQVPANYLELDWEESAQRVWSERRNMANFFAKGAVYLGGLFSGQTVEPVYEDGGKLDLWLAHELDGRVGVLMEESTAMVMDDYLELTKGIPGREVDRELLKETLFALVAEGKTVSVDAQEPQFVIGLTETLPEELDMEAVYEELYVEPQDASVSEEEGGFQKEVIGISFDVAQAQSEFQALSWGERCEVPLVLTEPEVKLTDLEEYLFQDVLGTCQTNIGGTNNRLSNVKLAASFCNELVLSPGETFSYDGTVGRRTSARGFLPAPAYVAGETVDEIGGGICQVSSTIYLASLRANMEIVERHNHGYTVGYVPNGLDATVYYGSLDFKFKNNTAYPIKIVATVSERTLTVTIYGTNPDNISVEMQTVQTGSTGYNTVYKIDNSVAAGSTKTSVTPYSGCTVQAYRVVYQDGVQISRTLESTSVYRSRDKVVLVNSADAYQYGLSDVPPEETGTEEPAPIDPVTPEEPGTTDPVTPPEESGATDPVTPEEPVTTDPGANTEEPGTAEPEPTEPPSTPEPETVPSDEGVAEE